MKDYCTGKEREEVLDEKGVTLWMSGRPFF
jgi:hypothetical protein